jgi:hypothetical protein
MSQSDLSSRLKEAITLLNGGRRAEAHTMLQALSQDYPNTEQVWMWLAAATDDKSLREQHLRRVLAINPRNEKARAAITDLTGSAPPLPSATSSETTASSDPAQPGKSTAKTMEQVLIAVLGMIALVLVLVIVNTVGSKIFAPPPTQTPIPSATTTLTPSITFTPSVTPGGPTLTPHVVGGTLPPSWTPQPTNTSPYPCADVDTSTKQYTERHCAKSYSPTDLYTSTQSHPRTINRDTRCNGCTADHSVACILMFPGSRIKSRCPNLIGASWLKTIA